MRSAASVLSGDPELTELGTALPWGPPASERLPATKRVVAANGDVPQ